jgi:hypothetical protein
LVDAPLSRALSGGATIVVGGRHLRRIARRFLTFPDTTAQMDRGLTIGED